ncbi:4Fe-4S binding protein [Desulfoluna sp.]|uniref:4Fe-4S binding protein n=1 Tax=Desulfoluna sp. TaxID=2045199 RepID=UPI00262FEB9E|nr:4Fe-4S binding protein [Desulfoluna sp.]
MKHCHTGHGEHKHRHEIGKHHHRNAYRVLCRAGVGGVVQSPSVPPSPPGHPPLETRSQRRQGVQVDTEKCVGCHMCEKVCPTGAITVTDIAVVHRDICRGCGQCVEACPRKAISFL